MGLTHDDYTVAWICALPVEMAAAKALLDEVHTPLSQPRTDHNVYTLGTISNHNVVLVCLPSGVYGTVSASTAVSHMVSTYQNIRFGLMVGIGGGVPREPESDPAAADIRLGDVVVSKPTAASSGVVQYDYGKTIREGRFQRTGSLNKPPQVLLKAIAHLESDYMAGKRQVRDILAQIDPGIAEQFPRPESDMLFKADYYHEEFEARCVACDPDQLVDRPSRSKSDEPYIHYGLIASGDQVMKDAQTRDLIAKELDILCFEMEAAGIMDELPSLVIRGICDYCDSHKHKEWQGYAALTAASYAKALLTTVPASTDNNRKAEKAAFTVDEEACLRSLFLTDPADDKNALRRRKGGRADGTCEWLLETDELIDWLQMSEPRGKGRSDVLWLYGNPGTGKSTMAMMMTDELPKQQAFANGTKVLTYFFCDSTNDKQRTAVAILRGLIYCLVKQCPYLVKFVLAKYRERNESLHSSFDALWGILMEMGKDSTVEIYCIIDALDECEANSQQDFIRQIYESFREQEAEEALPSHLHILITSRPYPEIGEYLSHFKNRDLASYSAVENDLRVMIQAKVKDLAARKKYPYSVTKEVSRILEAKAEGTFLWVGIACSELARPEVRSRNAVKVLGGMPPGLYALYRQLLKAALVERGDDDEEKETMKTMMKFVAFAQRPLTVVELTALCQLYPDDDDDSRLQFTKELIELCRLMIVIQDEHVRLLHKSVKDFLVNEELNINEQEAHADITNHCIDHMLHYLGTFNDKKILFLEYAVKYWPKHAGYADTAWAIGSQQESFFEPDSGAWERWLARYNSMSENYLGETEEGFCILHAAARWDIMPLILWGLKARPGQSERTYNDDEFQTRTGLTPLTKAADRGRLKIMDTLLNRMQVGLRVPARVIRVAAGNEENGNHLIKLLLDQQGGNIEITEEVLKNAAKNKRCGKEIVELLSQHDSQMHVTEEVLEAAAVNPWSGREVMEFLLNRQGDQMQVTEEVLKAAAQNRGSGREVMELLLNRQGDQIQVTEEVVKAAAGNYYKGKDILELLLDRRGHIHITEDVVKAAAHNPESGEEIIKLFLDRQGDRIPVTKDVVEAAARNRANGWGIMVKLCEKGRKYVVTEDLLTAAAANPMQGWEIMEFLLDKYQETKYCMTADVLIVALCHQPIAILASLLLDNTLVQFDLTEDIWEAAIYNKHDGTGHLKRLLQDSRRIDVVLTERLLMAISSHTWEYRKKLMMIFLNAGASCTVTKRVLDIIVGWFDVDVIMLLLHHSRRGLRVTEDQITAAFRNDDRLRRQDISSLFTDTEPLAQLASIALDSSGQAAAQPFDLIAQTRVLDDHDDEVWVSEFSHEGLSLCTASRNGRLIVYETETFSVIHNLVGHTRGVTCLAYSHDDTRLVTSSFDRLVRIWDTKTYECLHILSNISPARSLHWVTDEENVISVGYTVNHWSMTGLCVYEWPATLFTGGIACSCMTPDGTNLLVADSKEVHVLDIKRRMRVSSFLIDNRASSLVIDPSSDYLLASLNGGEVQLLDFNLGTAVRRFRGHHQGKFVIQSTFFGSGPSLVLSGSEDSRIYVWDRGTAALVDILEGHGAGCVSSFATSQSSPDMFVSNGDDHTVRVWVRRREIRE